MNRDLTFLFQPMSSSPCSHSLGFSAGFRNATHESGHQKSVVTAVVCLLAVNSRIQPSCTSWRELWGMWRSEKGPPTSPEKGPPKSLAHWGLDLHCYLPGKQLIYTNPGTKDPFKELLLHQLVLHPPPSQRCTKRHCWGASWLHGKGHKPEL